MIVAVLHVLPLLAHISRALDVSMNPIAYPSMQVPSSWLLPPLLILATWRHQQSYRRSGSGPSWHFYCRQSSRISVGGVPRRSCRTSVATRGPWLKQQKPSDGERVTPLPTRPSL